MYRKWVKEGLLKYGVAPRASLFSPSQISPPPPPPPPPEASLLPELRALAWQGVRPNRASWRPVFAWTPKSHSRSPPARSNARAHLAASKTNCAGGQRHCGSEPSPLSGPQCHPRRPPAPRNARARVRVCACAQVCVCVRVCVGVFV